MQKKQTILVVASLLVVVLSVTLAYFTAQIIGKEKDVSVSSADLKIIFTDTDGSISGTNIEPGWTTSKKFTVTNKSNETYKYNIVIQSLVNTFVTEGYLQYKIASTNGGYNMTEFKDVPKSSTATDKVLAYSASIDVGVTQTYTIEFIYRNDESVDQNVDQNKELSGKLFITAGTEDPSIYSKILRDNPKRETRTNFSTVLTTDNTKTLYTATEHDIPVYYFAGNALDNWVKLGGFYWRIIRTNEDKSIRLLYHGTSTTSTEAYIGTSEFNSSYKNSMYVGYKYGTSGSLESNRTNENDSTIKTYIDTWYQNNLTDYTKYLSEYAVYCNDRKVSSGSYSASGSTFSYAGDSRLNTNKTPTYDCTVATDAFSVNNTSAKLDYPIGLMTADEISYAGGVYITDALAWYYYNSEKGSSTGANFWWTMTPSMWNPYGGTIAFYVSDGSSDNNKGELTNDIVSANNAIRPVISIKGDTLWKSGDGSPSNPYEIEMN